MPIPKILGQYLPINFLRGRSDKSPKRREAPGASSQIQPPPPKRRRTSNDVDDDSDDDDVVRTVSASTSAQGQKSQIRSQQHLRSRASETSIDVLIQTPPDHSSMHRTTRQPSVTGVSSSHRSVGGGGSRNNTVINQPELRQAEQFAVTPKSGRRRRARSKFNGSLGRPANMKSPSPGDDDDDDGEGEALVIVDDDVSSAKKTTPAKVNTNVAVILSDGRFNNASSGRFRDRMMAPPQRQSGKSAAFGVKRYLDSDSGDELSEEHYLELATKRHQQQQTRNPVVEIPDYSSGRKKQSMLKMNGKASSSSPKAANRPSSGSSPRNKLSSVPIMAEAIRMSPLAVESAFRQPDSYFLSDSKMEPYSLTLDDRDPDLLVPLEQTRARNEKMHWLRVDLTRARELSFHINSPIVFFSFPQGDGLGAMLGLKFKSAENARQLVAWVTDSPMSLSIKCFETTSIEFQRRKFDRCLTEVLERREQAATEAEVEASNKRDEKDAIASSPAPKKSPPPITSNLVSVRRTRSSRSLNGATETIDLEGQSAANDKSTASDRVMRLRNKGVRMPGTATRPLLEDIQFERWTVKNPNWAQDWRIPLTYSRTTVDKDDVSRLDEGEFLNDNIINFYMQFLQDTLKKSESSIAKRVYFHNTFFYEKLRPSRGREIAFDGVKRWTAKADLFSYDYIIVPVNEHAHWWLAIICNVPKILAAALPETEKVEDKTETPKPLEAVDKAEPIDVDSHRPQSVVVDDDDEGDNKDSDVKLVSVAPKQTSTSPPRLNRQKRDTPIDVDGDSKPNGQQKEPIVLDSVETDSMETEAKKVVKMTTPKAIEIHDGEVNTPSKVDDDDDEVTEIKRDVVQPSTPQPTSATKKGFRGAVKNKKVFIPPGKKQDPTDPRIFTLDSLGSVHTASVDHLKQWLMAEIAERKGVAPKDPGRLGMTAKAIPQQENFCDCGVYLLLYLQEFVKDPDSFIEDIVLRQERSWDTSAPDMRKQLRDLILHMQKEYQAAEEANRKPKKKTQNPIVAKRFMLAESTQPPKLSSPPAETKAAAEESASFVQVPTPASARTPTSGADVPLPSSEMGQRDDNNNETRQGSHEETSRSSVEPVNPVDPVEAGLSSPFRGGSASPNVFEQRP
ncbi:hypothetical protein SEUCBS139899_006805 [Sporothrix eucalyptigena]|uniref:Ubiquitin-like protease family profile domain-containing protein n=1 Tax=Sporothrix eucalyptigena TaxID=1812306 RepID=A0ABP0BGM5_9PEZI